MRLTLPPAPVAACPWLRPARGGSSPRAWPRGSLDWLVRPRWASPEQAGDRARRPETHGRSCPSSAPVSSSTTNGRGPTAPKANRTLPEPVTRQHRLIVARSTPRRRVTRPNAAPLTSEGNGRSIDSTSSLGPSTVCPGPMKNSCSGTRRGPAEPIRLTVAPCTSNTGAVSAAGDALQMFPASVARLRICTDPTDVAASTRAGKCRWMRSSAMMSVSTARAPIRRPASVSTTSDPSAPMCLTIDDNRRPHVAEPQPDQHIGPPGQQPGARTVLGQQAQRLAQAVRPRIAEGSHRAQSPVP